MNGKPSSSFSHTKAARLLLLAVLMPVQQAALGAASAASHAPPSPRQAVTENVIIAVIDGLRFDEVITDFMPFTMGGIDPDTSEPVPDPLIHEGSFYTEFYNTGRTITTTGHQIIVTGVRPLILNNGPYEVRHRPTRPTMFEYYRRELGIPMEKTWVIAGKQDQLKYIDYSIHPDFGYDYRSSIYRTGGYCPSDNEVYDLVVECLETDRPSLMLINFRQVDGKGHTGDWDLYTGAIKNADKLVYNLWQFIQSDEHYQGKTTFVVTTDHGRHSDGIYTGFQDHWCRCRGCRHLIFLLMGPDIKENTTIETRRDQIDIVPTVGALLGFQTPYAEGCVMSEMFTDPGLGEAVVTGGDRRPAIAVNADGLHLVWSRKNGQEWDILYRRSADGGESWTEPVVLFGCDDEHFYYDGDITAEANRIVAFATGYHTMDFGGPTFGWALSARQSTDGGATWGPPEVLSDKRCQLGTPAGCSYDSHAYVADGRRGVRLYSYASSSPAEDWTEADIDRPDLAKMISIYAIGANEENLFALWPAVFSFKGQQVTEEQLSWNLYFDCYDPVDHHWGEDLALTHNTSRQQFYEQPAIDVDDGGSAKVVWAEFLDEDDGSGVWSTRYQSTDDGGATWSPSPPTIVTDPTIHSWNPALASLDEPEVPTLCVWEAHRQGVSEIHGRWWRDDWEPIGSLTGDDGFDSVEPDLADDGEAAFLAWQDLESGLWSVKVAPAAVQIPGDVDGDGVVDALDLLILLAAWGPNPGHPADLTGDGMVDVLDLLILLGHWT